MPPASSSTRNIASNSSTSPLPPSSSSAVQHSRSPSYSAQHVPNLTPPNHPDSSHPLPLQQTTHISSRSVPPDPSPAPSSSAHPPDFSSLAHALSLRQSSSSTQYTEIPPAAPGEQDPPAQSSTPFNPEDLVSAAANPARIELSSGQPLTTHGKPRERVYLACVQCRNRKVRCDGAKPECFNCLKRADPTLGQCSYDAAPRRRGKDRTPGSRRMAPFELKKTRTTRSRIEEETKRKKAEVQAAVAAAQAAAAALSVPDIRVVQDPSSSKSVHAPPVTVIPAQMQSLRTVVRPPSMSAHVQSPSSSCTTPSESGVAYNLDPVEPRRPDLGFAPVDAVTIYQQDREEDGYDPNAISSIHTPPGVQFTRETWWDALLSIYASIDTDSPNQRALTLDVREVTTAQIAADLRFLFRVSLHWFAFMHVPRFFGALFDPYRRQSIQPSVVLSALALATFFQSSELEKGARGREKALKLLDQAHALFDASLSSGWMDVGLVQAAWFFAMFEIQAHPRSSAPRSRSAFLMLDSLIRSLSLTTLDIDDPRTSTFVPGTVPVVPALSSPLHSPTFNLLADPSSLLPGAGGSMYDVLPDTPGLTGHGYEYGALGNPSYLHSQPHVYALPDPYVSVDEELGGQWQCGCSAYSLGNNWPLARDLTPAWTNMPMWPQEAGEGEMRKEECRRLVWSTVMLTVTHSTKTTAGTDREPQHLWIKDPANYALLFPGENFTPMGVPSVASSKDSMWALYMRTLFLWHSCLRTRCDASLSNADRAQWAMTAWLELDSVEAAMDRHTCDIQTGFMLQMREVLFNTRMVVSNEFRRYIPEALTASGQHFYHEKAEWWMGHLLELAHSFREGQLRATKGFPSENTRRCFLMYWFMSQIMRTLSLWYADPSLTIALEVAKAFAPCVEFMMMIWPSPSQRREYEGLRNWLVRSCHTAGIPPPTRAIPAQSPGVSRPQHPSQPLVVDQTTIPALVTEPVPKAPPPLPALTPSPVVQPYPPPQAHAHLRTQLFSQRQTHPVHSHASSSQAEVYEHPQLQPPPHLQPRPPVSHQQSHSHPQPRSDSDSDSHQHPHLYSLS